ncbi:MAG: DUF4160 domain-containing protein [Melioribacteraceae bacterium]|nr:DUF4160 domain-containing protein [Melioribacteraceae bacterium]
MPTISMFYGIIVRMYFSPKEHNPPHFHAYYQGYKAVINIDNCALQRPLDDKNQIRIALEAEAILGVIALCELSKIELISSDILIYEISKISNITRKEYAYEYLYLANKNIEISDKIEKRATELEQKGIKAIDALHFASAEIGKANYFCTCDDKFLKKLLLIKNLKIKVGNPLNLIEELKL